MSHIRICLLPSGMQDQGLHCKQIKGAAGLNVIVIPAVWLFLASSAAGDQYELTWNCCSQPS